MARLKYGEIGMRTGRGLDQDRLGDGDAAERHDEEPVTARPDNRRQHQEAREPSDMAQRRLDIGAQRRDGAKRGNDSGFDHPGSVWGSS